MEEKIIYTTLTLYFEVEGAELFGGPEEKGYAKMRVDLHADKLGVADLREYARAQTENLANILRVPKENIKIISREEYEEKAED